MAVPETVSWLLISKSMVNLKQPASRRGRSAIEAREKERRRLSRFEIFIDET
jgi:hypothetical protein